MGELSEALEELRALTEGSEIEESDLDDVLMCRCEERYSIEEHGDGYALYFGRCNHKHGHNLLRITECNRSDILKLIERRLNNIDV